MFRGCLVAYGLLVPAATALSMGVLTVPASWVAFARHWIPMVDRVTAYGHPSPGLLQAYLTLAWLTVPLVALAVRGSHDFFARPVSFGTGLAHAVARYLVVLAVGLGILLFVWYWPNFGLRDFLFGPLEVWADKRKRFFSSTYGLALGAPVWFVFAGGSLEVVRSETAAFVRIWRSGYWR